MAKTKKSAKKPFVAAPDSPFADGYSLEGEAAVLKELIEAETVDPDHPLFPRFAEYEERLERLKRLQQMKPVRQQPAVKVAQEVREIGGLESEGDTMQIHTRDAMKLFLGRAADSGARAIAGGRRVAASLRQIWGLSSNDNPYADWLLVRFDEEAQAVMKDLAQKASSIEQRMEALRARGLSYSILRSAKPVVMGLGFTSPYGYAVARMMVEFDWLARIVKSAQRRDVLSSEEAYQALYNVKRQCRSVFEPVVRGASLMMKEELRPMTRADFLSADADAQRRVLAMRELFDVCPRDVFVGERKPRHARRSVNLSAAELALLESVPLAEVHTVESSGVSDGSQLID